MEYSAERPSEDSRKGDAGRTGDSRRNNPVAGDWPQALCDLARPLIRHKIRRLEGMVGITQSDLEDVEHNVYVRLLERLEQLAPRISDLNIRIATIVKQSISNELRYRRARKRDCNRVVSLNAHVMGVEGPVELGETVTQRELDARLGRCSRSAEELVEMGMDIETVLEEMSQDLQDLAEALGVDSVSEIARRLGTPRTTLQDRVRDLRERFEDAQLREYL